MIIGKIARLFSAGMKTCHFNVLSALAFGTSAPENLLD